MAVSERTRAAQVVKQPDALMLHYLDDLDSKIESMRAHFEREPDAEWTGYNPSLERPLLNSRKYLEKVKGGKQEPAVTQANGEIPANEDR